MRPGTLSIATLSALSLPGFSYPASLKDDRAVTTEYGAQVFPEDGFSELSKLDSGIQQALQAVPLMVEPKHHRIPRVTADFLRKQSIEGCHYKEEAQGVYTLCFELTAHADSQEIPYFCVFVPMAGARERIDKIVASVLKNNMDGLDQRGLHWKFDLFWHGRMKMEDFVDETWEFQRYDRGPFSAQAERKAAKAKADSMNRLSPSQSSIK